MAPWKRSFLAFVVPVIIVGGLVLGVFTPSEGGVFTVVYALALSVFVYRSLNLRLVYRAFVSALMLTGELLVIVALSFALGASLSSAQVPQALGALIETLTAGNDSLFWKLAILTVLAIVAGMSLDPLISVPVPVILPRLIMHDINRSISGF